MQAEKDGAAEETVGVSLKDCTEFVLDQAEKMHLLGFLNNIYAIIRPTLPVVKEQLIELEPQKDTPVSDGRKGTEQESGTVTEMKVEQDDAATKENKETVQDNVTVEARKENEQSNRSETGQTPQRGSETGQRKMIPDSNSLTGQEKDGGDSSVASGQQERDAMSLEEQLMAEALEEYMPVEGLTAESGGGACRILVKGLARSGRDAYAGDIELIPTGENGFDRIRLGSEQEYAGSVVIREDASPGALTVYVTNGKEERSTVFSYTRDTADPGISIDGKAYQILETGKEEIYCTNSPDIRFSIQDGEQSAGVDRINLVYGDRFGFIFDHLEEPCYTLPEQFYGRLNYSCQDRAGNISEAVSRYLMIEKDAPSIQVVESERYTAPYTMGVSVEDSGEIISGIQTIECFVNGQPYELNHVITTETVKLANDLEVPAKQAFSLNFEEIGHYDISIRVIDNCGNAVMLHKEIDVTEEELVAVFLAKEFKIYVDPDRIFGGEQVFSKGLALKNISSVDTRVTVKSVNVDVKSEKLENGVEKDCQLYLVAPDTGERIPLQNGLNENVYSFVMPADEAGTLSGLDFVGELTVGSEPYWKQGDIGINLRFEFEKIEK